MSEVARSALVPKFEQGEKPQGRDFENLIDSCVNKVSDGVSTDGAGDLVLSRGLRLGNSTGGSAGGLRFNNNQLQVFTGGAWTSLSGGGGFQSVAGSTTAVAHDGNVGIGAFAAPPTFRLEVNLDANNGPANQARLGNLVCARGSGTFDGFAMVSHRQRASNEDFALRQSPNGAVHLNAPLGQVVGIRQGGDQLRLGISNTGHVVVGAESDLPGSAGAIFQVAGEAFKLAPGQWAGPSDARVKDAVRDLELGLAELQQVRTVRFRYNGRAGTTAGQPGVGVIGQEIETVVPETIRRVAVADDPGLDDMRVFDPSALTYVLINAVKELAVRVEHLEQALAAATAPERPGPVVV